MAAFTGALAGPPQLPEPVITMIKRALFFGGYFLFCLACFLLAFEVIYRYQLIDFFQPELRANNSTEDLRGSNRITLLAMGDSFTAGNKTWVTYLREQMPDYRIINAGVSATGVFEAQYMAPRRFRDFQPKVFIYQVYVGNDIQDIRRPLNWRTMTPARYLYGFACSYLGLRSLTFANYRLAQLVRKPGDERALPPDGPFSPVTYPVSVTIYTRAEPGNLEDTILARGQRGRDVDTLITGIKTLTGYAPPGCRKYVVVVPDAAQVSDFYLGHMRQLGVRVSQPREFQRDDYPMLHRLQEGFRDREINVLNPLPLFKEHERQGRRLYYSNDSHLKPVGQALLGQFILDRLTADGLAS